MTHAGLKGIANWLALLLLVYGCASDNRGAEEQNDDGGTDTDADTDADSDSDTDIDTDFVPDPVTCDQAEYSHTYVGCDFWPTVLPNVVGTWFDYAVVVSNAGFNTAEITIEFAGGVVSSGEIPPGKLEKFFLPWIGELKHWTALCDTGLPQPGELTSKRSPDSAYHLTSTFPVTAFQFNPIEYGPQGGPEGKDWSGCNCMFGCNSYTNDASLLLPSTAATGNYRITAPAGQNTADVHQAGYISITGYEDDTQVTAMVSGTGAVTGGDDIPSASAGEIFQFTIDQGEVVRIVGTNTTDLSGSVLNADKPIGVMSGAPCMYMPDEYGACDHLEESVMPAETLGTRYFVAVPTNARGNPIGHVVRLVGNVSGTQLTYSGTPPAGAPSVINSGQVYDLGNVGNDFEISSDEPFAIMSFLLGSTLSDPGHPLDYRGDPAQSNVQPVEQYRKKYVFLAPDDYDFSFIDVIAPDDASITLDGAAVTETATPISNGFVVYRIELGPGEDGAHVLESDEPVGLQVMGYGFATSYHYPGGLNLLRIADPPIIE